MTADMRPTGPPEALQSYNKAGYAASNREYIMVRA